MTERSKPRGCRIRRPATHQTADAEATRRASLSIGWQIMLASAVLVLGIVVVAVVFILHQSLPREQIARESDQLSRVYVDIGDVFQGLALIGVGAVLFAGLVSWFIARRAVRPLGDALRLQREFVADASHELRTPLSVLDARIQVLERRLTAAHPPTTDEAVATVGELRADSRALIAIVNDLLLVAGGDATAPEPLLAGPVIVTAVDSLRILAAERGVQLTVDVTDETTVRIAEVGLRRCVVALVDNALAHSPRGTHVSVTADRVGADLVIRVADHGAGIVGIAPERVFDRFAHAASVRPDAPAPVGDTPARPGFGIGLALVREIVTRHGGRVRVESTSPAGTVMAVELPAG